MAPLDAAIHSGGGGPCLHSRGIGESTARSRVLGVRTDSRGSALGRLAINVGIKHDIQDN
jgi:hypothetical protein